MVHDWISETILILKNHIFFKDWELRVKNEVLSQSVLPTPMEHFQNFEF